MVIELFVVQFWSEIILVFVISNGVHILKSHNLISDQIVLHSVKL